LVFTDLALRTDTLINSSSLVVDYLNAYQVMAQAHSKISLFLVAAHNEIIEGTKKDLIIALVIWILVLVFLAVYFVGRVMR
jgi:hypothetical protein